MRCSSRSRATTRRSCTNRTTLGAGAGAAIVGRSRCRSPAISSGTTARRPRRATSRSRSSPPGSGHGFPARRRARVARHRGGRRRHDAAAPLRARRMPDLPPYLAELPLAPAHLLASLPRSALRTAPFNDAPVGNGPFVFRSRAPRRALDVRAQRAVPGSRSAGRPRCAGSSSPSSTRRRRSSPGSRAESSTWPASRRRWSRSRVATRRSRVLTYPVLFGTALFFNTTRPPFDDARVRLAVVARDRPRADRRGGARRVRDAVVRTGAPRQSARVVASRRRTTPLPPTRCSMPPAGGAARTACAAEAARRSPSSCLPSAAATTSPSSSCRRDLRGARHPGARETDRDGRVPHHGARRAKQFDLLIAGVPGDLSLAYVSALFDTRAARRHARLHRLPHACARHAPPRGDRVAGRRAASRRVASASSARSTPSLPPRGSTTHAACRECRVVCAARRWTCAASS